MLNRQDVINLALMKIGNAPKVDITDSYLVLSYKIGKEYLLGLHYWSFAKQVSQLSIDANVKVPGWEYGYRLPSNLGRVVEVLPYTPYEIYGNSLVSNSSELSLVYSANDISDSFPNYFGILLAVWISKEIATVVKNGVDSGLTNLLNAQYAESLSEALAADSSQSMPLTWRGNRYVDSR